MTPSSDEAIVAYSHLRRISGRTGRLNIRKHTPEFGRCMSAAVQRWMAVWYVSGMQEDSGGSHIISLYHSSL